MGDAHVFRIHTYDRSSTIAGATAEREVTAEYYQHEHGFVTFKDRSGGSLYMVREELVHQIERVEPGDAPLLSMTLSGGVMKDASI